MTETCSVQYNEVIDLFNSVAYIQENRRVVRRREDPSCLSAATRVSLCKYGFRSRDRDGPDGLGSIFIFSTPSSPNLGPTQPLIQWVLGGGGGGESYQTPPTIA
jgi:hypothetical protein